MNSSIDQQFIEFVVKSLVGHPDDVVVARTIDEKGVLLELTVNPEDLGRVIGKRGATAQSLRTLLRALGTKNDASYHRKIMDNGEPMNRPSRDESAPRNSDESEQAEAPAESKPTAGKEDIMDDDDETFAKETASHDDVVSKTRKELADLDDLDV